MQSLTKTCGRWLVLLLLAAGITQTAAAQRTVTLRLNTASLPDTTSIESLIQVRGALDGVDMATTLPDDNIIAWGDASTLEPMNVGGDYWEVSFQLADTSNMAFKFYSDQAENGGSGIGGWEDGGNHELAAGANDTTLTLHFFEKGDDKAYDWRPFESKEDTVAVWFRVYMNTEAAVNANYDVTSDSLVVGVRGDDFTTTGPLDWGATLQLAQESTDDNKPGQHLFSGVAYYPASLVGSKQFYKFVFEDYDETAGSTVVGWEGDVSEDPSGNRYFTVPASDTTLHWTYFSNSTPASGAERVSSTLLFAVDMTPLEAIGIYDRGRGDSLEVRGEFNNWSCSNVAICQMQRVPGEDFFEGAFTVTAFQNTAFAYKYFINFNDETFQTAFGETPPNGWEEPISTTGANRSFTFLGSGAEQDIGLQFFNDVLPGNIIPDGNAIQLTFQVRMDSALVNDAAPFVPGTDSVTVEFGDPIWAFSQGLPRDADGNFPATATAINLTDDDQDGLYTGSIMVNGPTFGAIQYKYSYGGGQTYTSEQGGGFNDAGRRRTRYIAPNADGSWPTEWTFPEEVYLVSGVLPFEANPVATGVERIDGELPSKIALEANYPNPFNPVTTIEYSVTATEHVKLQVFDLTGRLVATLVDSVQPAASYRVGFDAQDLASGMYLYRLQASGTTITRKMVLLK
ncbi:MAG: T9SS type A sorting domain-containing protein [Rhodothermales bacterium]